MNLSQAERHKRKILRRIARAAQLPRTSDNTALLNRERLGYARSSAVKFATLMHMRGFRQRQDQGAVFRIARSIDVMAPCADPVRWWPKSKRSGGYRAACSLPLQAALGQRIACDLVVAQFTPTQRVFDWKGRGYHRYVNQLADAIRTNGPFVMAMDITSCYPSIDIDAVYRLDLIPAELVRSTIDHRELSYHRVQNHDGSDASIVDIVCIEDSTGPGGLLQGGAASSSLLAALLHGVAECVAHGICCLSYADYLTLIGVTEEAVVEASRDIAWYVTEHHSGRLNFRQELHDVRDGFEHFGFRFEQTEGDVAVSLPDGNLYRVLERLENLIDAGSANGPCDLEGQVRLALAPFPCLTGHDREVVRAHAELHWLTRSHEVESGI